MKHFLAAVAQFVLVLFVTGLFCAIMLFSPVILCHGQGAGGNCGEGFLASIPITLLASPFILAGVAAFFSTVFSRKQCSGVPDQAARDQAMIPGYPGVDADGVAEREADHFGCPVCGAYLDMRNPGQVLAHIHQAQIEIVESDEPPPRDRPVQ